ncbi:phenylacetate--CoA ligase family protein [Acetivibrio mesophilus]|uniref:Phenylacetate--CoA ligase family protein n=1 Tax=Acetivibrio mesophilus TaxID=2487273 RepID=A0A4Q0I2Z1_9FIRM|nr:AMP-binding protein [Acetivibrio mesophilus]RXE58593.1 phenylacetate--CoA ligase family protein [Acetivibrio mesophilus]
MKKTGIIKAMMLCWKYEKMSDAKKSSIRQERLHKLVSYAKQYSPYYKERYKNLGDKFELSDLPPTNKRELMAHFDEWVTDRSIKLSDINEFMKDLDNIGRKLKGDYLVFTTSGSTGDPLVMLCDRNTNNVMGGISATRTFARKQDMKAFLKSRKKTIGVFATGGFYLGNSSVRSRLLAMPWKKRQMAVTSALLPISQIVNELNDFQPAMLGGYPTILELLIDEQKSGRLNIKPVIIMTGGEYLGDSLREKLSEAFKCYVQTSYSCTEAGTIACECTERHFHINDDWVIVEPVDKNNKPVSNGIQSDKILLTNLFNYTQPFIRYEVTDRVVMHHEPCPCGNPSPWLTLEGRTDDIVTFFEEGKEIKIAPLAIYAVLKEVNNLQRFQVVVHKNNKIELRINLKNGYNKEEVFQSACLALTEFLASHDIEHVEISLSKEEPKQHPKSGKFKHIINKQ